MSFVNLPWATISALLSAVAAIAAAVATWRAPRSAALLAETLRQATEQQSARQRSKYDVFAVLMAGRARIDDPDVVSALNRIDLVFVDCRSVRDRWAELLASLSPPTRATSTSAMRQLLAAMAEDLGLSDRLNSADLDRTYFPNSLDLARRARQLENELMIAQARGLAAPVTNAAGPDPFPPAPT